MADIISRGADSAVDYDELYKFIIQCADPDLLTIKLENILYNGEAFLIRVASDEIINCFVDLNHNLEIFINKYNDQLNSQEFSVNINSDYLTKFIELKINPHYLDKIRVIKSDEDKDYFSDEDLSEDFNTLEHSTKYSTAINLLNKFVKLPIFDRDKIIEGDESVSLYTVAIKTDSVDDLIRKLDDSLKEIAEEKDFAIGATNIITKQKESIIYLEIKSLSLFASINSFVEGERIEPDIDHSSGEKRPGTKIDEPEAKRVKTEQAREAAV